MNLIFDFDGTICDSVCLSVEVINKILQEHGYEKVGLGKLRRIGIKGLAKSRNIPISKIPKIALEYRKYVETINENAVPFKGIKAILKTLSKKHTLGILTSNKKGNVQNFLDKWNLNYFDFVYSEKDVFGKDKVLKKIIFKHNLKRKETYYIGDETRDVEAAKKLKIKTVAVTWGFESKELLMKSDPNIIITKPTDLLKIWN